MTDNPPSPSSASTPEFSFLAFTQQYDGYYFFLPTEAIDRFHLYLTYAATVRSSWPQYARQTYINNFIYGEFEEQNLLPAFTAKDAPPSTLRSDESGRYFFFRSTFLPAITIAAKRFRPYNFRATLNNPSLRLAYTNRDHHTFLSQHPPDILGTDVPSHNLTQRGQESLVKKNVQHHLDLCRQFRLAGQTPARPPSSPGHSEQPPGWTPGLSSATSSRLSLSVPRRTLFFTLTTPEPSPTSSDDSSTPPPRPLSRHKRKAPSSPISISNDNTSSSDGTLGAYPSDDDDDTLGPSASDADPTTLASSTPSAFPPALRPELDPVDPSPTTKNFFPDTTALPTTTANLRLEPVPSDASTADNDDIPVPLPSPQNILPPGTSTTTSSTFPDSGTADSDEAWLRYFESDPY